MRHLAPENPLPHLPVLQYFKQIIAALAGYLLSF
jgi:hypothetical protein